MKKMQHYMAALALVLGVSFAALIPAQSAGAIDIFNGGTCSGTNKSNPVCKASKSDNDAKAQSMAKTVINTMLYIIGILSVIMIVFGGIRYTISSGDAGKVKSAKDTIMYAVIGLVIALVAFTIVNFVLEQF